MLLEFSDIESLARLAMEGDERALEILGLGPFAKTLLALAPKQPPPENFAFFIGCEDGSHSRPVRRQLFQFSRSPLSAVCPRVLCAQAACTT